MNADRLEQILAEYEILRDSSAEPAFEALKVAILLEDVFEIQLSDNDIELTLLNDTDAVRNIIVRGQNPA
jgi:hypothetical protein